MKHVPDVSWKIDLWLRDRTRNLGDFNSNSNSATGSLVQVYNLYASIFVKWYVARLNSLTSGITLLQWMKSCISIYMRGNLIQWRDQLVCNEKLMRPDSAKALVMLFMCLSVWANVPTFNMHHTSTYQMKKKKQASFQVQCLQYSTSWGTFHSLLVKT